MLPSKHERCGKTTYLKNVVCNIEQTLFMVVGGGQMVIPTSSFFPNKSTNNKENRPIKY